MPKQSRLTGAISLIAAQAIVLLLGYVTHLWVGRALGPGPYGIYGIVLSIQTIAGLLLTLGVPMAVSRFVAQDEHQARSVLQQALRVQLLIAIGVSLLTLLVAPLLARLLGDSTLSNFIRFVSLVIFLQAFYQVYVQFLSGLHLFNRQAALTGFYAVVKLIAAVSLLYFIGVYGALAGFAIGGLSATLLGFLWTRSLGGTKTAMLSLASFLTFAGTYVLILISLQLLMSLDLFMVKAYWRDDVQAGLYNAAVTLSRIPYLLLQGLAFILLPSISALTAQASHDEAARFIRDTLRYLIALIVPSAALAAATSRSLITLFFSRQYLAAAPALTILMVGLSALAFYLLLANIAAGAGQARVALLLCLLMLLISTALGMWLVPSFGLIGAAWQTTIVGLAGLSGIAAYTFRRFRIPIPLRSTLNVIIATIIAVSVTYFWPASPRSLVFQYALSVVLYLLALYTLGEITAADRRRLASLHPRLRWLQAPSV
ncbi:MAG: polysaccharide biosynthesis protein [Candidatus Andersenbacteria bacterium]|nr:polysaccharide biosynthesis protein [Candidatus Andersenbacteria bacterium]